MLATYVLCDRSLVVLLFLALSMSTVDNQVKVRPGRWHCKWVS